MSKKKAAANVAPVASDDGDLPAACPIVQYAEGQLIRSYVLVLQCGVRSCHHFKNVFIWQYHQVERKQE